MTISDAAYHRLMTMNNRMYGTIGLVNPAECNFNEHVRHAPAKDSKFIKLRHGRATVSPERVRLTLNIGLDEADITPSCAIVDESRQASEFVRKSEKIKVKR